MKTHTALEQQVRLNRRMNGFVQVRILGAAPQEEHMGTIQGILYLVAVVLLVLAAFGLPVRVNLALLAAAAFVLAYALPAITDL
jgi:hypothetical protein